MFTRQARDMKSAMSQGGFPMAAPSRRATPRALPSPPHCATVSGSGAGDETGVCLRALGKSRSPRIGAASFRPRPSEVLLALLVGLFFASVGLAQGEHLLGGPFSVGRASALLFDSLSLSLDVLSDALVLVPPRVGANSWSLVLAICEAGVGCCVEHGTCEWSCALVPRPLLPKQKHKQHEHLGPRCRRGGSIGTPASSRHATGAHFRPTPRLGAPHTKLLFGQL